MTVFFSHEDQAAPASLSDNGKLHVTQKSQLTEILQGDLTLLEREPESDAIIIDGSALINSIPPVRSKSFDDYFKDDILSKVMLYAAKYERVDVVFDVYKPSSLKSELEPREEEGSGEG